MPTSLCLIIHLPVITFLDNELNNMLLNKMGEAMALGIMEEMTYLIAGLLLSYTMLQTSFMVANANICLNMVRHAMVMDKKRKHCHAIGDAQHSGSVWSPGEHPRYSRQELPSGDGRFEHHWIECTATA